MLFLDNTLLCFDDIVLCFDHTMLCFDNIVLCFNNIVLCFDNTLLRFDNTVLCLEKCLLCLQIWATVVRYQISLVRQGHFFNDGNMQRLEKRMLDQRPRESGVLSTRRSSSSQTVNENNTSFRNVESTAVAAQLSNLFPTVGKSSFGRKSCNSKCCKVKTPPVKKVKKDVVHKDVILLPSPNMRSVPTHQT